MEEVPRVKKPQTPRAGWPKVALAHSFEGRVGQAWGVHKVLKETTDEWGKKKIVKVIDGHFRCKCGAVVRIDKNGFAACEKCGLIYNDGSVHDAEHQLSNRQKKKLTEKFIYDFLYNPD